LNNNSVLCHIKQDAKITHAQSVGDVVSAQLLDVALQTVFQTAIFLTICAANFAGSASKSSFAGSE
jgi:hypothetical protein